MAAEGSVTVPSVCGNIEVLARPKGIEPQTSSSPLKVLKFKRFKNLSTL